MFIECNIKDLQKIIFLAEKVTSKNSTLQALETILIEAKNNSLEVSSTNLSLGFHGQISASVKKDGIVSIKSSTLAPVVLNLNDDGVVSLSVNEGFLIISTKNTTAKCLITPNDDFPNIPFSNENSFKINKNDFVNLLKSTFWSASVSEIKPELSSVYLYNENKNIVAVATDGYRLAEKKSILNIDTEVKLMIPFKNIPEIIKIIPEWSDNVFISYTKNHITFSDTVNNFLLSSRLIDGNFPDYKQIIPNESTTKVIILKDDILKNIRISNAFVDKFNHIRFNIDSKNNNLSVYAGSNDLGEVESNIPAKIDGEGLLINFNYKYFIECLSSIDEQSIVLNLTEPNKPIIINGLNNKDFLYLLMPLNR